MEHLFEMLARNAESDRYPCHMPGHKRSAWGELPQGLCRLDITEIEGFDNLHQPEGLLLRLQKETAALCGAEESFYLVNGSTGGILSAVSAALPAGGHLLMARNCHRAAYHAAYLRNLKLSYLYPELLEEYDVLEAVTPGQVREALQREPEIGAVLVVSPTYEGRIADVAGIAEAVHERGLPLIVDEAHGAHLGLSGSVQENSCRQGADLVIQSVHKTLPALTQAALLHVNGSLVDRERLKRFLRIYQTSSPSYLLMASIDNALYYIRRDGERAFAEFHKQYTEMLTEISRCKVLKFLPADRKRQDLGKLLISVKRSEMTGRQLYDLLLQRYGIQAEMAAESFVLAMFTVNDRREGYERMTQALLEIDEMLEDRSAARRERWTKGCGTWPESQGVNRQDLCRQGLGKAACELSIAWDADREETALAECAGRLAGEFVNLYPPGVPLLVPGERITGELCERIADWLRQGLSVQGVRLVGEKPLLSVLRESDRR